MLKNIKLRVGAILTALTVICSSMSGLVNVRAIGSAMLTFATDGDVVLDGSSARQVKVSLTASKAEKLYTAQGKFATTEKDDADQYFTVNSLDYSAAISAYNQDNNTSTGEFFYKYATAGDGVAFSAGAPIYVMTYDVKADTPAGTYHLPISVEYVQQESIDDYEEEVEVDATVTVTRNVTPVVKPSQVVTFKDDKGNQITEITKQYGDEDFVITKEVTTGDGEIVEYHPDDDGTGRIAHTAPDSNDVGVGEVGDVEICAWVAETSTYAATRSCYTVHVVKRQIEVSAVTIADKEYDGTSSAEISAINFADMGLGNEEYEATATFDNENVGDNKSVTVSVSLKGNAVNNYTLKSSSFATTGKITPRWLVQENVALVNGNAYDYSPDGVTPEVRVTSNTHGGVTTLLEDRDYEVSYRDNAAVGNGHVYVSGKGNFTTGENPVIVDFAINAREINNSHLNAPNSIVEGRQLTNDEISVVVDGHTLTRCANDGDGNCDYVVGMDRDSGVAGDVINLQITGRNNYGGSAAKTINITAKAEQTVTFGDVTDGEVTAEYGDAAFTHIATSNGDGKITYRSSNSAVATVDENTGAVTVKKVGEAIIYADAAETSAYAAGTNSYHLTVQKKLITVSATFKDKVYDGTANAEVDSVVISDSSLSFGGQSGAVYSQGNYFNGIDVGNYENEVTMNAVLDDALWDSYTFSREGFGRAIGVVGSAKIMPFALTPENTSAVLNQTDFEYTGGEVKPTATVKVDLDGDGVKETTLTAGTDYTMVYTDDAVNVGMKLATIMGKGNYDDLIDVPYYVRRTLTADDIVLEYTTVKYNGDKKEPKVTVKVGHFVVNPSAYTVTYSGDTTGSVDVDAKPTVTVTAKEGSNYIIGSVTVGYTIEANDEYEVVKGDGQGYVFGSEGAAEFEINANYSLFEEGGVVYVDEMLIDPSNYDSWSSSTVIALKPEFMKTLALGEHKLKVLFNNGGSAEADFTIKEKEVEAPKAADTGVFTGAGASAVTGGVVVLVIAIGAVCAIVRKNKEV